MSNDWQHGLCGCFDDIGICVITYFVPCYTFGKNAEQLGESCVKYALAFFVPILNFYCLATLRGRIREQKGIEGSCLMDLLMHLFCGLCALVQEAQELKPPGGQSISRE